MPDPQDPAPRSVGMSEREFIGIMGMMSAMAALSIDILLPGFGAMRETFDLSEDSTSLAATITLFIVGQAVAMPFYGPLTDAFGRTRLQSAPRRRRTRSPRQPPRP